MEKITKLKCQRLIRNLSQEEVSRKVGIHENTLASYEKHGNGKVSIYLALATFYNCKVEDLIGDQE